MPRIYTLANALLTADGTGDAVTAIDFGPMLDTVIAAITGDFAKYALVAGAAALTIWGAPKALVMVKKFFSALSR